MEAMSVSVGFCAVVAGCVAMLLLGSVRSGLAAEAAHPVYAVEASADRIKRLVRSVARIMAMSEEEMVALVPDRTGFRFMGVPQLRRGDTGGAAWVVN